METDMPFKHRDHADNHVTGSGQLLLLSAFGQTGMGFCPAGPLPTSAGEGSAPAPLSFEYWVRHHRMQPGLICFVLWEHGPHRIHGFCRPIAADQHIQYLVYCFLRPLRPDREAISSTACRAGTAPFTGKIHMAASEWDFWVSRVGGRCRGGGPAYDTMRSCFARVRCLRTLSRFAQRTEQ